MFYLLENNKIIDSRISYTSNFPYWEIKDNCLFAKSKNDKLVRPYNENKIKKQSENVFDLVDVGDLIKSYRYESRDESDGYDINNVDRVDKGGAVILIAGFNVFVSNDDILAIYKPDSKGNYIKVWENQNVG